MKCLNCGIDYSEEYTYCPNCGTVAPVAEPVSLNPVGDKVLAVLKDKLFFVLCILITISSAAGTISGMFSLLSILATIFLWIAYSKSRNGVADSESLRCVSGTVYASYIITNVACGFMIAFGVIFCLVFAFVPEIINSISELSAYFAEIPGWSFIKDDVISIVVGLIGPIIVIIGIVSLIINVLGMRKIHRFIKSVYQGINNQNPNFEYISAAKNWLMAFGVLYGISALGEGLANIFSVVVNGTLAAAMIIASILINKYFLNEEQQVL